MQSRYKITFLAVLLLLLVPAGSASAQNRRPTVTTGNAIEITPTGAVITGAVHPRSRTTNVFVMFGSKGRLNSRTPHVHLDAGTRSVRVRIPLSGLEPVRKYSYRLAARNTNGLRYGKTRTFTTPRIPASVTLSSAPAVVTFGQTAVLSGSVGGTGAGGSTVQPEIAEFPYTAGFGPAGNALIARPDGTFGLTVQPRVTTQYRAQAKVDGKQTVSPIITVGVAPKVNLKIRRGRKARFSGTIAPGGDAVVRLMRISSTGKRRTVARTITRGTSRSTYRFPSRRIGSTREYVVTVTLTNGAFVRGQSRVRKVRRTRG